MKRILIIAAHPDDEVLGCGGLISKLKNSDCEFMVIFMAEGSSCRYENYQSKDANEAIIKRNNAAKSAMKYMGIMKYEFINFPCGRLDTVPIIEINKRIEHWIKIFQPDTIFTHSSTDSNNDHKIIYSSVIMATRPTPSCKVLRLYTFEVLSSSEWGFEKCFKPNYFIQLNETDVENKFNSLNIYNTEVKDYPFPRSREGIKANAMIRGMQVGVEYAEAFRLIREISF
ncbi:PIG-L family deacetylase [Prochlorococcus sp. MIT 1307]|uniref:PIG-L deacetylase family protein n=1 Tax=Prochlorococcus sp. MIT 1307 TaxID=3096219 RepID=UPI002A750906|nr:PIG-L family deacetylase [Prochlorococcus sp. MIT 1307]